MFVVIIGVDGAGKTTLLNKLKHKGFCTTSWHQLAGVEHFRDLVPYLTHIKDYLNSLPSSLRALQLARIMYGHYEYFIEPELRLGNTVICDSYYFKLYVKERLYGRSHSLLYNLLETLPKPDLVIFLSITPDRLLERTRDIDDYEYYDQPTREDYLRFQSDLQRRLKDLLNNTKVVELDADLPSNVLESKIYNLIRWVRSDF